MGKKFSEERNKRISETLKSKYESGERVSATKGIVVSEKTRIKLSITSKGRLHTDETKKKMSEAAMGNQRNVGRKLSEETKNKISNSHKKRLSNIS